MMIETINTGRGQSLVELAISLMVILILLTGAVETGLALFQYVTMRDAAQEGALYGSFNPPIDADTEDAIKNRVIDAASDILPLAPGDITLTVNGSACEGLTGGVPNSLTVTIEFEHPVTMPIIGAWIGQTIDLTAGVTDTILSPVCP